MGTNVAPSGVSKDRSALEQDVVVRRRMLGRAARALHLTGIITALCVERVAAGYEGVFCRFFVYIYTTQCDTRVMFRVAVFAIKGGCPDGSRSF